MLSTENILHKVLEIQGVKVMLDKDLAELYGVQTKVLKQAVRRNSDRFPKSFMFELTKQEFETLRSQFVTLENGRGKHSKYLPMVFTEHGLLMLANVLRSKQAIQVSIRIIEIFIHMRKILATNELLYEKIQTIEHQLGEHNQKIQELRFEWRKMVECEETDNERVIGFQTDV